MKKPIILVLVLSMLFSLTACTQQEANPAQKPPEGDEGKNYVFGMTTMGEASFWDAVESGILSVLHEGDELIFVEGRHGDAAYQQSIIEDFIAQGVDLVFYNPTDSQASLASLELLKEAGIPIINFDSKCADLSYCLTYCATDNYNAGVVVAEHMMKEHPEGGKVGVIEYVAVESASIRSQGFVDTITASGKWEIVAQLDGGNTTDGALPVAEDILTAHPDIDCIFTANDEMGLGAYSAITNAGMNVGVYSINGGPESKNAMLKDGEDGIWRATGAQSPIIMGSTIADLAYKHFEGETLEPEYLITPFIICPENIEEYGHSEWQ
jgi:ribose transport system substrate-binding protein